MGKSKEYWIKRAAVLEYNAQKSSRKAVQEIVRIYGVAADAIAEEIKKVRRELMRRGEFSEEELLALLSAKEREQSYRNLRRMLEVAEEDGDEEEASVIRKRIDTQAYGVRITRLEGVYNMILSEMLKAAAAQKEVCDIVFGEILQNSYTESIRNFAEAVHLHENVALLPKKAIEAALKDTWKSSNYSKRIWKYSAEMEKQFRETITAGLMSGKSSQKMVDEIVKFTDQGRYAAERLVRTETAHFMAEGQRMAYQKAGIARYRFVAEKSERTCEVCMDMDGTVYAVDEIQSGENYPPLHPNCRCTTIPEE